MLVWVWCVLLASLIHQTFMIHGYLLPVKDVKVDAEGDDISIEGGAWMLNVEWRDAFVENAKPEKLMYDIEVLLTENMMTVHKETIEVKPDLTNPHRWKWTSVFPLQCTSHSVKLRHRDQHQTGPWSPLYTYTYKGNDPSQTDVYPHDQTFLVGSNITFCCIVREEIAPLFNSSVFTIRISNRTYITEPFQLQSQLSGQQDLHCDNGGTTVYVGYPPDDQNLRCVTRDLSSVECYWDRGQATLMTSEGRHTKYTLNGRDCQFNHCRHCCVVNETNVMNWTLTATNPLGVKILHYTADPLHRVLLKAPKNILTRAVYERNATIQWDWNVEKYASFSMTCQVELNGHFYNKNFSGSGLTSVVLVDLQPFADYTAKVRCGSSEHFYMGGDWSDDIHFRTKEDIPEAVDVWIQYLEQNTYVLWKNLTKEQSHGVLTGYELTMINSENEMTSIDIHRETLCYGISFGNKISDQKISVSAKNSAGLSPPASITIKSYPGNGVNVSQINGTNGGFKIFWEESASSSCGYVVDWFPTYRKEKCALKWKKIPSGHLSTSIQSDQLEKYEYLQPGDRYTVSVYSCTTGAPQLLQRREGYAIEQRPSATVTNLTGKTNGRNLVLSWEEVPLDEQGGFIQGYRVITIPSGADKASIRTILTNETTVHLKLDPGTYDIMVAAFTSAGEGVNATCSTTMDTSHMYDEMIVATVLGSSVAALVFIVIAFLCYRKKKWIKKMLYPDIPEPKLLGQWAKGMYCSQMTEAYIKCEIQEIHGIDPPSTSLETAEDSALINSNSSLGPANLPYQNISELPFVSSFPPVTSFITLDPLSSLSSAKTLTSFIENPTYIMTWPESADISQISGPTLEMDDTYLPAPMVVHNFLDTDSGNYKPHSLLYK